jgi:uncharacterized membrane protein (DUF485 family)
MARWQRDPKLRRRLAYALATAEVLALSFNFYYIFTAYFYQLWLRLGLQNLSVVKGVAVVAAGLVVVAAVAEGIYYVRGRLWAQRAFVAENVVLIVLGLLWFAKNRLGDGGSPAEHVALYGLVAPIATLLPLLWPLLVFKPVPPSSTQGLGR